MVFEIALDREEDGRWIAEIASLPGVIAYGATQDEARSMVEALALRVIADRTEVDHSIPDLVRFAVA